MKFLKHLPDKAIFFTAILIGLLVLFAAMQYRWVGQVSDAERERLRENLQTGVTRLSHDFDREISRAFLLFQMRPDASSEEWKPYSVLYRRWLATSEHPQLIQDVFVAKWDGKDQLTLRHLNAGSGELETAAWPPELAELREGIESECRNPVLGLVRTPLRRILDPIAERVPALVIPPSSLLLVQHGQRGQRKVDLKRLTEHLGRLTQQFTEPQPRDYAILVLNRSYISQELLPSLARQYLANGDSLDYRLAVIGRDSDSVVYESEPDAAKTAADNPDSSASLFSLRLEEMTDLVSREGHEATSLAMSTKRVSINIYKAAPDGSATVRPDEGRWRLVAKHRAGSLDAMVSGVRRRNLAASLGILVLLALSVVMLVSSTRRAQRLARQQMEFAAGVSHELRTPLAVIRSAGQNLADRITRDPEQVVRYGALIEGEGRRLTEMVEQILDLSGIQSGRKSYTLRGVEVEEILKNAIRSCEPQVAAGKFHIEQVLEPSLPAVNGDSGALSQAIANLLSNAMKYSGPNKTVHLSAGLHRANGSSEVRVSVSDEGIGIDPSDLPHIFEPFYRGRAAVDDQIHGNGLGLCLVKQIVEAHGGRASVDSVPGKGSTFTLHIPALKPPHNGGRQS